MKIEYFLTKRLVTSNVRFNIFLAIAKPFSVRVLLWIFLATILIDQCKMQTADCRLQTADCRLQTGGKMQTRGKMQTKL